MAGKGNGYAKTRKGPRADLKLPEKSPRSGMEANFLRLMKYKRLQGVVTHFEYETLPLLFPGKDEKARGNKKVHPDFPVVAYVGELGLPGVDTPYHDPELYDFWPAVFIETKGRLPQGGRLDLVDLSPLDERCDQDSRIKLERLRRHYPTVAKRFYLIGEHEWALITKRYKGEVPNWE